MAEEEAVSQLVKLKIHYTFDAEHKNDHLSKPPQSQEVQTFLSEEGNTIGVIDLRTCLDAVNLSSPELTATLDSDFTVYAYDYSEANTPLVGQGMLSKVLSAEGDSEAMVTGRITKNLMAKFTKNAQPFLEVKLRLTPIASTMQRGRSGSMSSVSSGMHQQFSGFSQNIIDMPRPQSPAEVQRFETMQRMLSEGAPRRDSAYNSFTSGSGSRPGTPTQQYQLPNQPPMHSRQSSQTVPKTTHHSRHDSFSGYYSADEQIEDGPARKRARITQVKQPTRADLNIERQPDSLRVMASTASSVRIHRPTPINPLAAIQHGLSAEEPVRPPTPVPQIGNKPQRGRPRKQRSYPNLEKSSRRQSSPAPQPPPSSLSPEDTRSALHHESTMSTPADIPSSPPIMPEQQDAVFSPQLPENGHHDSGLENGGVNSMFDQNDFNIEAFNEFNEFLINPDEIPQFLPNQLDQTSNPFPPVFDDDSTFGGPTPKAEPSPYPQPSPQNLLAIPQTQRGINEMPPPIKAQTQSQSANQIKIKTPMLLPRPAAVPQLFRTQSNLPQLPASDPITRSFHRSNTWAPDMSDAIMSDSMNSNDPRKGKGSKKLGKEQTAARLENAIASGIVPPFCDNCGAIETPAWRRAYAKIFYCSLDEVQTSSAPGECCYKEVHERNPDGSVKSVKGYKREQLSGDKSNEWVKLNLCNPCGLWFQKQRFPRPAEKWQKKNKDGRKKRKRPPKQPKTREQPHRAASSTLDSEAQEPPSEDSSPADTSAEEEPEDGITYNNNSSNESCEPELPPMPPRSASAATRRSVTFALDTRQVQSSPLKHGTADEPIGIDLTPKPLRRVLFPSPNQTHHKRIVTPEKKYPELLPSLVRRSPRLNKTRDPLTTTTISVSLTADGKENATPEPSSGQFMRDLFDVSDEDDNDNDDTVMPPPLTPTPNRRSERIGQQHTPGHTPSRGFGHDVSANVQRTPRSRASFADLFFEADQDPKLMTPFSRALHGACTETTPKSRSTRSKHGTPRNTFDFPDLPSLNPSSPMSHPLGVNFSELTTDKLKSNTDIEEPLTTDAPLPSSPPGWTGMDDFLNMDPSDMMEWNNINFDVDSMFKTPKKGQREQETGLLEVKTPKSLRRSPRHVK